MYSVAQLGGHLDYQEPMALPSKGVEEFYK
jgi:hypothetical protein